MAPLHHYRYRFYVFRLLYDAYCFGGRKQQFSSAAVGKAIRVTRLREPPDNNRIDVSNV